MVGFHCVIALGLFIGASIAKYIEDLEEDLSSFEYSLKSI